MLTPINEYTIKSLARISKVPANKLTTVLTPGMMRPIRHTLLPCCLLIFCAFSKDLRIPLNLL